MKTESKIVIQMLLIWSKLTDTFDME